MVPYCSKTCQKEHWKSNHKALCVKFSAEKSLNVEMAKKERAARAEGLKGFVFRQELQTERMVESIFWALFQSDRGMLEHDREIDEETQNRADRSVCPVNITDKQEENGWIAEYLKFLDSLLRPLLGSV